MKILITGFEPFLNNDANPSMLIVNMLKDKYDTIILPVSYSEAKKILENKIKEVKPDIILSLGLASSRDKISLELIGINYQYALVPDNDNKIIKGTKIQADGLDGIFTNLDILTYLDLLKENNIPGELSLSAGAYICNLVYYTALNYTKNSLFIHLPNLDKINLETSYKAINLIIDKIKATI